MTSTKQILKSFLAFSISVAFFSCNNSTETAKEESKKAEDTVAPATTVPATPAPAAFTPFDVVEITHAVKDYAKWRPAFNTDSTARKASGLVDMVVGRSNDKPNTIMIVLSASDVQKAKAFAADPRLKNVMDKNGVISKPRVEYFHVIRFSPDTTEPKWVTVTHKVKDFDAWLKVFDAEGPATRATFGLADAALARGIDDPNIVHIVFDVKDMAKAKARMSDPALKKLMTDAGVEGAPKIEFYTTAE